MARRSLLLLVVLLPALAACAVPGTDAADVADCEDDAAEFFQRPGTDSAQIHRVCEALVEAGLSERSSDAEMLAILKARPELTGEMCEIFSQADPSTRAALVDSFGGYVAAQDIDRFSRDVCVYAITEGYGSLETGPDVPAILRAHPYLAAPFCRAPLMQAYDAERPPQPRRVYEEVVTDVCMEGIRTGVVDYSSFNILEPNIHQRRFRALLDQEWAKR